MENKLENKIEKKTDSPVSVDAYEVPEVLGSFDAKDILSAAMGDSCSHLNSDPHRLVL